MDHAPEQFQSRCPYRNKDDQCTAHIGCRNQRKPPVEGDPLLCGEDGGIDYRSAWESNPEAVEAAHAEIQSQRQRQPEAGGIVRYEDASCPAREGDTLFDHADTLAVRVPTSCGRTGTCHECVVEITRGAEALSGRTDAEAFLSDPFRLCCQAAVADPSRDIEFSLLTRAPKILTRRTQRDTELDPMVTRRGDRVYYGEEDIDGFRGHIYGLILDVGTTTVAGELVDLESGESLYVMSFQNPQRFGGSDVMHRISYDGGEHHGELHKTLVNTVNDEIRAMEESIGINRQEIYELVVVGNSTMRELFFNRDVQSIGLKPYKSDIEREMLDGKRDGTQITELSRSLRLRANKNARVYGAPLIASHVGADVAADLLAMGMGSRDGVFMLVDVGTNTEVVIGTGGRLIAASCPAGPAFEGGLVTYGMMGVEGAIETIRYVDGAWEYETIGNGQPKGLCGSALIDLLAELRRHDLSTAMGVFADKVQAFTLVPDKNITFSRLDASHLAQAKAANTCGQYLLMRTLGLTPDDIDRLYLAGGFANYVDPQAAIDIGMLAPVPIDRIEKIGNAALEGAREMLVSRKRRREIEALVLTIEHAELETAFDFFEMFAEGCQLKPMDEMQ